MHAYYFFVYCNISQMDKKELIDYSIKATWHSVARLYNQYAVKHNITTSMAFVLLNIDSKEGTHATKIAPLMGMEARSLTRILKSMENKKLITRKKDAADGREDQGAMPVLRIPAYLQGRMSRRSSVVYKRFLCSRSRMPAGEGIMCPGECR